MQKIPHRNSKNAMRDFLNIAVAQIFVVDFRELVAITSRTEYLQIRRYRLAAFYDGYDVVDLQTYLIGHIFVTNLTGVVVSLLDLAT